MSDFTIVNLQDLTTATGLTENDFLAIGQGSKALTKATISQVGAFLGISSSVKIGDKDVEPTEPSFAFAEAGLYPEWGNIEITGDLGILIFDGADFSKTEINFVANGVVEEGNTQAVSGGEVFEKLRDNKIENWTAKVYTIGKKVIHNGQIWEVSVASTDTMPGDSSDWIAVIDKISKEEVGVIEIPAGMEMLGDLIGSDIEDEEIWGVGFLNRVTGMVDSPTSPTWRYSINYYDAYPGIHKVSLVVSGNAGIIAYDKGKNMIAGFGNPNTTSPITHLFDLDLPEGTRYIRISFGGSNTNNILFERRQNLDIYTNKHFATPEYVQEEAREKSLDELSKFGFEPIQEGVNFLEELTGSSVEDASLWGRGFLTLSGAINPTENVYHSLKYYKLYPVRYNIQSYITGNERIIIYDKERNVIHNISASSSVLDNSVIKGDSIRISFDNRYGKTTDIISLTNLDPVYIQSSAIETVDIISEQNKDMAVNGFAIAKYTKDVLKASNHAKSRFPVVSFIADDGRSQDEWYIDVVESYGIRSSFAIPTVVLYNTTGTYLSKERIIELYRNGHDIISHTHSHINLQTGGLTPEEIDADLLRSKNDLLSIGIDATMFVAPQGGRSVAVDRLIRKYFDADFISGVPTGVISNASPIDPYLITRQSFDAGANGISKLQDCKDAVDYAIANNEWLVFAVHPAYSEYHSNNKDWQERRNELAQLIEYIQNLNVPILTAKTAYEMYKNPVQIGNARLDNKYYVIGMDGTEEGNFFD